ncbi:MAG: hypothetical protein SVW77_04065, partial [Candidatus Nanohaloarchaea archaeon]|nr:hypothetical protein [Candidatus Nanohaloarchaea archaeon]
MAAGILPWVFAGCVTVAHYAGSQVENDPRQHLLTSVAVGATVAYVFLDLLPRHAAGLGHFGDAGFLSMLAGFAGVHAVEKYILQHEKDPAEIRRDFKELHTVFLLSYYLVIGVVMHYFFQRGVVEGVLLSVPVILHTGISSLSLTRIHEDVLQNRAVKTVLTLATPIGVGLATLLPVTPPAAHLAIGGLAGLFLYIMVSDSIAQQEAGR